MHSHFLKKFLKKTLHFSGCLLSLNKWNNGSVASNIVINITPPYIFNSTHRSLSRHKCKKKICHHKILANFQIKSPHCNGRGSRNHVQPYLLSYLVTNNMETYYPCNWISFLNQKKEKIRNWSLLMKIIYLMFLSYYFSKQLICILYSYSLNMQTTKTSSS